MSPSQLTSLSMSKSSAADIAKSELVDGNADLLSTGKGSDLTITCNGSTFKVHKAIVASRNTFFDKACWGGFIEAQSNTIDLPDDDPELVRKMLDYFYLLDYKFDKDLGISVVKTEPDFTPIIPDIHSDDFHGISLHNDIFRLRKCFPQFGVDECWVALTENGFSYIEAYKYLADKEAKHGTNSNSINCLRLVPELAIHASMYGIADKYGVQGLKSSSVEKLEGALRRIDFDPNIAHSYISMVVEQFAAAVQAAWTSTLESDKGVRTPLLQYASKYKDILLTVEAFKNVISEEPQFAYDLLAIL